MSYHRPLHIAQTDGDGQLGNALANEHQVLVEGFQCAAHVVGNVCRSALFDPVGKLLHRGAQGEQDLVEAVEQAGNLRISEHRDRPFRLIVTAHFANA